MSAMLGRFKARQWRALHAKYPRMFSGYDTFRTEHEKHAPADNDDIQMDADMVERIRRINANRVDVPISATTTSETVTHAATVDTDG